MTYGPKKYFCFLALAIVLVPLFLLPSVTSFAGVDCKEDFSKIKPVKQKVYRLSAAEKNEIRAFCRMPNLHGNISATQAFNRMAARKSPEFLFYLVQECNDTRSDVSFPFRNGLGQMFSGKRAQLDSTPWAKLKLATPNFEGVPAALRAEWRKKALRRLAVAKRAALEVRWDRATAAAEVLFRTKLAMPYLSPADVKDAVRSAASVYALHMGAVFPGIYPPKAFQFAKEAIKRELGLDYVPLTDLVALKRGKWLEFKVISVDTPTLGRNEILSEGAFRTYSVEKQEIPARVNSGKEIAGDTVEWRVGERKYRAKYSAIVGEKIEDIAPALTRLDYAGLWKDKKLTGMIFPGANMGTGAAGAHDVMNNYKAYYHDHGFHFAPPKRIPDMEKFMEEEMSSGRLDYVIKEAHAEGSDTSLVKIVKGGTIATGRRPLPGGKEEVVHIFYPEPANLARNNGRSDLLYSSVAGWMKKRTENGGKQIFFLDTSCYGIKTACKLVNSVENKNLVVGGSDQTLETFANEEGSGISKILDGLRNSKPFRDMKATGVDAGGEARDKYVLPGMAGWQNSIHGQMSRSVDTKVELFQDGTKIDIETLGDQ